jgi:anti-sigma regulatory factor (Ser/Thr protein kinase)
VPLRISHKSIVIDEKSSIGEARRAAAQIAQSIGFEEGRRNDISIVVTELATNVLLHAAKGELLICPFVENEQFWLDILAIDEGPGIRDVGRAMEDGFSSHGTAGQGLGAITRLSDDSSIYSNPDKGTIFWSRFKSAGLARAMPIGLVNIPVKGESVCGDGYFVQIGPGRSVYMMVDGLGHGPGAAEAAEEAIATMSRCANEPVTEIILRNHDALKKTRGAAFAVAIVDHERLIVTYGGVGNISANLITGSSSRSLISQNGTLGAVLPRVPQEYTYPIEQNTSLLMFSDGLASKTSPIGYPGLQNRHPAVAAGILYRDFSRKRDDASVMLAPIGGKRA